MPKEKSIEERLSEAQKEHFRSWAARLTTIMQNDYQIPDLLVSYPGYRKKLIEQYKVSPTIESLRNVLHYLETLPTLYTGKVTEDKLQFTISMMSAIAMDAARYQVWLNTALAAAGLPEEDYLDRIQEKIDTLGSSNDQKKMMNNLLGALNVGNIQLRSTKNQPLPGKVLTSHSPLGSTSSHSTKLTTNGFNPAGGSFDPAEMLKGLRKTSSNPVFQPTNTTVPSPTTITTSLSSTDLTKSKYEFHVISSLNPSNYQSIRNSCYLVVKNEIAGVPEKLFFLDKSQNKNNITPLPISFTSPFKLQDLMLILYPNKSGIRTDRYEPIKELSLTQLAAIKRTTNHGPSSLQTITPVKKTQPEPTLSITTKTEQGGGNLAKWLKYLNDKHYSTESLSSTDDLLKKYSAYHTKLQKYYATNSCCTNGKIESNQKSLQGVIGFLNSLLSTKSKESIDLVLAVQIIRDTAFYQILLEQNKGNSVALQMGSVANINNKITNQFSEILSTIQPLIDKKYTSLVSTLERVASAVSDEPDDEPDMDPDEEPHY